MKNLLKFICILSTCCISAQINKDTTFIRLEQEIAIAPNDSLKVAALLALSEYEYDHDFSNAKQLLHQVFKMITPQNELQWAKAKIIQGVLYRREGLYPKAIEAYLEAQHIYKSQNDLWNISDIYHNIGMVYRYQKESQKAIATYRQSIKIKKTLGDTHGIAASYNMMGVSYKHLKKMDSALFCYQKARTLFESIKSIEDVQRVDHNMINVYTLQKEYKKAEALALVYLADSKVYHKKHSLSSAYYILANINRKTNRLDRALKYADSSLQVATQEGFRERIAKAYLRKSYIYSLQQDYKNAYYDYRKFNRHSDSIFNIENIKKIQALELNHQFDQQRLKDSLAYVQSKREIEHTAQDEASQKRWFMLLFILALISGLVIALLLKRIYRNKALIIEEKLAKEKAQKDLLDQKIKAQKEDTKRLIADNSMRLSFKQELLNKLKNDILPLVPDDTKQAILSLSSELHMQISTENKLSGLHDKVDEVNAEFDTKLRTLYPNLTKTEREVCALLRLNLSIKEIMTIRNVSVDSVKSTRYRIRKKLGLTSKDELEKFIQNLS
ncbi:tetratricopeptide repeat protein [Aquimarina rhabdastrellae]